jgi:N-acetylglutamate synthase-like GNAT family acetyltransferase
MIIFNALSENLPEIERLNDKYFHEVRNFKKIIESSDHFFFVGKEAEKVIGFSGIQINHWNNSARIIDVFVHPKYRRRGYAAEFLQADIAAAKKSGLRTIIAEAPSLNPVLLLYLKGGFRICGFNDRYYSNKGKEMALFLSYDLP